MTHYNREQQQVQAMQRLLRNYGYAGPVNGTYDPAMEQALRSYMQQRGSHSSHAQRETMQRLLRPFGYNGRIEGIYGPIMEQALNNYITQHGGSVPNAGRIVSPDNGSIHFGTTSAAPTTSAAIAPRIVTAETSTGTVAPRTVVADAGAVTFGNPTQAPTVQQLAPRVIRPT